MCEIGFLKVFMIDQGNQGAVQLRPRIKAIMQYCKEREGYMKTLSCETFVFGGGTGG